MYDKCKKTYSEQMFYWGVEKFEDFKQLKFC